MKLNRSNYRYSQSSEGKSSASVPILPNTGAALARIDDRTNTPSIRSLQKAVNDKNAIATSTFGIDS
ncbi:MAG TPA: hypothetical protein V6D14_14520 [Coleofasciculaceae cyanobacterium]